MQNNWNESELILALRLYYQTPFGKMHKGNKDIINLADILNRTPSSVAMKLSNFARFDDKLINRNIKGLSNGSKLDKIVWDRFTDLDLLEENSNEIIENLKNNSANSLFIKEDILEDTGKERGRKKQSFFRKIVLSNYTGKCCITGFSSLPLLVASHIVPWSKNEKTRLDPENGLLLNSIHDKAFDQGLITLDLDYRIVISENIKQLPDSEFLKNNFIEYHNKQIVMPEKYLPNREFIKYHNQYIFKSYDQASTLFE